MLLTTANTVNAAQAVTLATFSNLGLAARSTLTVRDNATNLAQNFDTLQALAIRTPLSAFAVVGTDTPTLAITAAQYLNDVAALRVLSGKYLLDVIGTFGLTLTTLSGGIQLDGRAGGPTLNAAAGGNILIGGDGDILNGGAGPDRFVFHGASGLETVNNFRTAMGNVTTL